MKPEQVFEPFCGPGGMGHGFASSFQVALACDFKEEAVSTYSANHPGTTVQRRDVRDLSGVRGDFDGIAGVIGGPPCQPFSLLNVRKKKGDPRSLLMYEFMRLVEEIKPRFFVLENVPWTPNEIKLHVQRIGRALNYSVDSFYVNASDYGAAQTRKRWILVGQKGRSFCLPSLSFAKTVREAFAPILNNWGLMNCRHATLEKLSHVGNSWESFNPGGFKGAIKLGWDRPSPAVVNLKKVYMVHPSENRNISLAEAAALQGFPPDYVWKGTQVQIAQMIANAMPVELARKIAESLVN